MKNKWEKPVITIVVKSTTEENVLASCKHAPEGTPYPGPNGSYPMCYHNWETGEDCNQSATS